MVLDAVGGRPSCRRAAPDRAGGWILQWEGTRPLSGPKLCSFLFSNKLMEPAVLRTTSVVETATLIVPGSFPEASQATLQMRSTGQGTGRTMAHEGKVTGSSQIHKSLPWGRVRELTQAGVRSRLSERTRLPPEPAGARGPLLSRVGGRVLRPPQRPAPTPAGGSGELCPAEQQLLGPGRRLGACVGRRRCRDPGEAWAARELWGWSEPHPSPCPESVIIPLPVLRGAITGGSVRGKSWIAKLLRSADAAQRGVQGLRQGTWGGGGGSPRGGGGCGSHRADAAVRGHWFCSAQRGGTRRGAAAAAAAAGARARARRPRFGVGIGIGTLLRSVPTGAAAPATWDPGPRQPGQAAPAAGRAGSQRRAREGGRGKAPACYTYPSIKNLLSA